MRDDPDLEDAFRVMVWRAVIVAVLAVGLVAHARWFYGG